MTSERRTGILSASIGAALWGSSGIAGQILLQGKGIPPEWLTFFRLLVSGLILVLTAYFLKKDIFSVWKNGKDRLSLLIFGALGMLGTQYCYFAAIRYSNAPTATILQYLMPILIIFWTCFREKRRPSSVETGCTIFAIAGTALIATAGDFSSLSISPLALFWGLLSALSCAIYSVVPVTIIKKYGSPSVVGWGMLIASVVMGLISLFTPFTGTLDGETLGAFGYVVFFGTVLAFGLYLNSVAYIKPAEASIIAAFEPLSSIVFAFLLFHTLFGFWEILGIAFIIIAVALVARK